MDFMRINSNKNKFSLNQKLFKTRIGTNEKQKYFFCFSLCFIMFFMFIMFTSNKNTKSIKQLMLLSTFDFEKKIMKFTLKLEKNNFTLFFNNCV